MATVTAGYNWTSGETVTPAKLNSAAAPTVVVADGEVTTAKILDAAVTDVKLASGIDASKLTAGTLPIARIADGAVTPAKLSQPLTLATSVATTSGTAIDFTGIPSWAKRITVMLDVVSTNGTAIKQLRIGDSNGVATTGYVAGVGGGTAAGQYSSDTGGFNLNYTGNNTAGDSISGAVVLTTAGSNKWMLHGAVFSPVYGIGGHCAGVKTLSGTLDRIRLTTFNGTDTFDAGSVNIIYEG